MPRRVDAPLPDPVRHMVARIEGIPVWQRTEKEQRIMAFYELAQAQKARRKPAKRR
jgi:hypothetical protein